MEIKKCNFTAFIFFSKILLNSGIKSIKIKMHKKCFNGLLRGSYILKVACDYSEINESEQHKNLETIS